MKQIKDHDLGFNVYHFSKKAFDVTGFTKFVKNEEEAQLFWQELKNDGRLSCLCLASMLSPILLGCGSYDDECAKYPSGTYRYTACIEKTDFIDLTVFDGYETFSLKAPESEWICFELEQEELLRSWDNGGEKPYTWIDNLGYSFNHEVGFHFDVIFTTKTEIYVPEEPANKERIIQFWMPVVLKV